MCSKQEVGQEVVLGYLVNLVYLLIFQNLIR